MSETEKDAADARCFLAISSECEGACGLVSDDALPLNLNVVLVIERERGHTAPSHAYVSNKHHVLRQTTTPSVHPRRRPSPASATRPRRPKTLHAPKSAFTMAVKPITGVCAAIERFDKGWARD